MMVNNFDDAAATQDRGKHVMFDAPPRSRRGSMGKNVVLCMALIICCMSSDASALTIAFDDDSGYPSIRWPGGVVPVCWEPGIDPQSSLPIRIREAVENSWARHADITFTGWQNCVAKTPPEMPSDYIVFIRRVDKSANGLWESDGTKPDGRRVAPYPFPTVMDISFAASWLCDTGPFGNSNDECVAWSAVHEFGHALGFKHEHERQDGPGCGLSRRNGNAMILTEYDEDSVMNYCSDGGGTNEGSLSRLDIVGVQLAYGRKPWGTIIGPGGRCFDADNSNGLKPGSRVQLWDCLGGSNQRWLWSPVQGTLQLEANLKLCLDDPSGGKTNNTELVLADCTRRVTKRWDFVDSALLTMGDYTLGWRRGVAATSNLDSNIEYTDHGYLSIGNSGNCALTTGHFGLQLQEVHCNPDWPEQQFFLAKSGQVWNITRGQVTCLEVDDEGLPGVSNGTPIRVQECDANRLTQKFNLGGFLRGTNNRLIGIDGTHFISFNGLALRTESWDPSNSEYFHYYFGRTDVLGLD